MKNITLDFGTPDKYTTREAYNSLRANVQFCDAEIKTIAITSCDANEGKSTISINLAKSFAMAGKKVLLVDADMRNSTMVRKYVRESGIYGLSQFLSGQVELDDALFHTQIPNFDIMFAGKYPPNPVELLANKRFTEFIQTQREIYDYVFIDTPPLGLVIDCAVVSHVCDGAIMVVASGKIKSRQALMVKDQLEKSGTHVIGAVLNHISARKNAYMRKYYSKYYYSNSYTSKNPPEEDTTESK